MIRQNIGTLNALIRITCGLTFLSYASVRMTRKPWEKNSMLLTSMAALKVAEGIVRYCPVTDVINRTMTNENSNQDNETISPINPS
ncbi:YgaP family membrane protein [Aquibacillus rhizosphaerae]|uniref:DUF2892 domain-containing protein n=1 Tax=Aquibacillus rhizosphaerae TaxID=3051431 RepID=A0ABT7L842_9BACI|nr:DUF2892 domain-containing protein [Aquibacillus sp. LR5S19]MDL4842033.1 DUF2892 domain-containing protein [Aquibacillus sp. LR5S19]